MSNTGGLVEAEVICTATKQHPEQHNFTTPFELYTSLVFYLFIYI